MSELLSAIPPTTAGTDDRARPRSAGNDDFAQLLAMLSGPPTSAPDPLADSPAGLGLDSIMSPVWGGGLPQAEQLLTFGLIQLIQRLLDRPVSQAAPEGLPVRGPISQAYHAGHHALDIAVPGGTPVRATLTGRVVHAGWNAEGYGNLVIVENGPYQAYYAHLSSIPVRVGDNVEGGEVIGLSGNTGHSTGPHLHYEVRYNGAPVVPDARL